MSHDYAQQRAETESVFADLQAEHDLPDEADIDYFFMPVSDDADWRPLADILSRADFDCEWIEDEEDEPPYLVATLAEQPVSALSVWTGEELATKIALDHGFTPDGWGFSA